MPISKKIKEEIKKLETIDDEKELMLDILELEDTGIYQFREEYSKRINFTNTIIGTIEITSLREASISRLLKKF